MSGIYFLCVSSLTRAIYLFSQGHVRVVQALMKKGALLHRDHNGNTPLHLAAKNGHKEIIKLLLNVHSHLLDQVDKDGVQ